MPQILMPYTVHLDHTLRVTPLNTLFAKGDSAAHRFELTILSAGVQEDLTGCTVLGKFYRMADSAVVSVPGSVEDGKAVVVLDASCYDYIGRFALTITIQKGEEETTVFYGDGYMHGQRADTAISGEYIIYDINTLLEKIAEIDAATRAANTATGNANTATANANAATGKANTAASAANTSAANANAAKDAANAAAGKIDAMTVSATPVETGTATAALSTVDGHYHLALGLPKGDTGATPRISVQVQTGAAGSEASVSVTGTAEEPVIHLTIPRGDVGAIENLTINGKPVESGTITLTAADLGAATAEEVSQLKDDKLDKTGTAADSSKLGGVAARDYALKTDTAPDSSKLGGKTLAQIMLTLYPVGSVYISANSTSPASLFGGTWEQIRGRFLLASGSPDANTNNLFGDITGGWVAGSGSTGGQDYHTLTVEEMPSHTHESQYVKPESGYTAAGMMGSTEANWWSVDYIRATGGGQKHNNMPPYLAVNMWKRVS